ncbi:MAG TPA: DUF2007 domain-containing protein [Woeseiaceae bacterium]|nr:DUF2007 domain-containing protein [Woeseiaceae bacterium]
MKKLTTADSLVTISHYRNLLASEGIPTVIRNEYLGSVVGEIPYFEAWPELWVRNDLDYDRARELIDAEKIAQESPQAPWTCRHCGADNEGQFAACWQCGRVLAPD